MKLEPRDGGTSVPDLVVERRLLAGGARWLASVDEVGRGAVCGPAHVGVVLVGAAVGEPPEGVRDSKLLTAAAREALVPAVREWAAGSAVGAASAAEVDRWGITAALRLAAHRALAQLPQRPDVVLVDGSYDWVTPPVQLDLFCDPDPELVDVGEVHTLVKADLHCASVAAASVLAKVARDQVMDRLAAELPGYGLGDNRGYGTPSHLEAIRRLGPSEHHRRSWNLPGDDA